jgi:hypothetical protein
MKEICRQLVAMRSGRRSQAAGRTQADRSSRRPFDVETQLRTVFEPPAETRKFASVGRSPAQIPSRPARRAGAASKSAAKAADPHESDTKDLREFNS